MSQYRGPISLNELEQILDDFDRVRLRPVTGSTLPMPPGHKQLTTLGYIWPCGCETRGTGTPANLPACWISPCLKHVETFDSLPVQSPPSPDPPITVVMARLKATLEPGGFITLGEERIKADFPELMGNDGDFSQIL